MPREPSDICTCGHTFANHRPLYENLGRTFGPLIPIAWRCDDSDGCMDFELLVSADLDARLTTVWEAPHA